MNDYFVAPTGIDKIRRWLERGKERGATHVLVVWDRFDNSTSPLFVMPGDDLAAKVKDPGDPPSDLMRTIEVYNLALDLTAQLNERRAWNL